jgi:TonB family protein
MDIAGVPACWRLGRRRIPLPHTIMKTLLLPLLALPFLLGACSSFRTARVPLPTPPAAVRIADQPSAWGTLPSYSTMGQYFVPLQSSRQTRANIVPSGTAVLDVLVNHDGSVKDAAIVTSSGIEKTDLAAAEMCRQARYSLPLGPDAPAPYVVRLTVAIKNRAVAQNDSKDVGPVYFNLYNEYGPHSAQNFTVGSANIINGFPR